MPLPLIMIVCLHPISPLFLL